MRTLNLISSYISFMIGVQAVLIALVLILSSPKIEKAKELIAKYDGLGRYLLFVIFCTGFATFSDFFGWGFHNYLFKVYRDPVEKILSYILLAGYICSMVICMYMGSCFTHRKKTKEIVNDVTESNAITLGVCVLAGSLLPVFDLVGYSIKYRN